MSPNSARGLGALTTPNRKEQDRTNKHHLTVEESKRSNQISRSSNRKNNTIFQRKRVSVMSRGEQSGERSTGAGILVDKINSSSK